jgi:H/ACA ribonucleoprotein complex subunit 3
MNKHILFCNSCKKYTIKETCSCGSLTKSVKPAKFSLEDKWGKYRREAKKEKS